MAIGVYFPPESMTASQYDDVIRRLEAAGVGRPKGRLHHSCFGPDDNLMVYDVWDSQESLDAFAQTLMPIIQEVGVKAGQPDVLPIHNMIQ